MMEVDYIRNDLTNLREIEIKLRADKIKIISGLSGLHDEDNFLQLYHN